MTQENCFDLVKLAISLMIDLKKSDTKLQEDKYLEIKTWSNTKKYLLSER